jgi:DNA polymerase-3 subunit epsilon
MRQIVLDTETTGLEPSKGHRIVEIGCIELLERRRSGATFHRFLNPEREIDAGALAVHGITEEFLRDKPRFADIADDLWRFLSGAELIIHNAAFDLSFLEFEFSRVATPGALREQVSVLDTLALARERYPGQKNNLDALCKRLGVDASHRELHGALLDASLLTDVYLAMTAGQGALELAVDAGPGRGSARRGARATGGVLRVQTASAEECAAHEARLAALDKAAKRPCIWRGMGNPRPK